MSPERDGTYVCTLSPELLDQACRELGESPSRRQDDIEAIRQWLLKQPHITARLDDWTILRFLRGCKFSLERTKEKLDMFYTCRTAVPEWFKNRDPLDPKTKQILDLGILLPLPGSDALGRKVVLSRFGRYDANIYTTDDAMKAVAMIMDLMFEDEELSSVCGMMVVSDAEGTTVAHMLSFTPAMAKKAMTLWQDCYPTRPKGINYINTPPGFETIFNLFKSFMKEKMKKRVHVHGSDLESLYKQVPRDILPIEYGGTNGSVDDITRYWAKKVEDKRDWLLNDEKFCVNESKRLGKPKTSSDLFGLEGTFRKLEVD
ncbi:alpha-tocopherol transfer protein-like isoform X2 [Oratosquilla oratoria]|uniref:alpha-tocopherol transfer protein-like isoform X2 n=1 Tax=Oratosquilla oratoria TaxID=337810 RepID=UPI003F76C3F8